MTIYYNMKHTKWRNIKQMQSTSFSDRYCSRRASVAVTKFSTQIFMKGGDNSVEEMDASVKTRGKTQSCYRVSSRQPPPTPPQPPTAPRLPPTDPTPTPFPHSPPPPSPQPLPRATHITVSEGFAILVILISFLHGHYVACSALGHYCSFDTNLTYYFSNVIRNVTALEQIFSFVFCAFCLLALWGSKCRHGGQGINDCGNNISI